MNLFPHLHHLDAALAALGYMPRRRVAWANRPTSPRVGTQIIVSDAQDAIMVWNGTRWRPLSGVLPLKALGAPVSGLALSETIVLQGYLPAGFAQVYDAIRVFTGPTKTGTTDQGNIAVRVGTTGTVADLQINTPAAGNWIGNSALAGGTGPVEYRFESATTFRHSGNAGGSSTGWANSYGGSSAGAQPAAVTIPSMAANGLYISIGVWCTGATNTIGLSTGRIELVTP